MYAGTIILRAIGFAGLLRLVVELDAEEVGLLKSTVRARWEPRVGGGSGLPPSLLISIQSGSGLGVNGLLGRLGFGIWSLEGGWMRALAGRPSEDQYRSGNGDGDIDTIVEPPLSPI